MKKISSFFIFLLNIVLLHGQQNVIDSLKKISNSDNDTLRLVHSRLLSEAYDVIDADSAVLYAKQYEKLSQRLKYEINYADALNMIAVTAEGNDASDLDLLFKAEKILAYTKNGNLLPSAYLKRLRVPHEINTYEKYSQYVLARIYVNFGYTYWGNSKYDNAVEYFNRALSIAKKIEAQDLLINCYFFAGVNSTNDDSSLMYLHKARNMALQTGNTYDIGTIEDFLAKEYRSLKDYKNQLTYLRASLSHHQEQGKLSSIGWAYIGLGEYYQKNEPNYDSALYFLQKAFTVSQTVKTQQKSIEYWSSRYLYDVYQEQGNKDSALKYVDIMLKAKEIVFNEEKAREFESKDYLEQKQRTETEKQIAAYRSRVKTYSLLAGLFVFVTLAIIFWRNTKRKQREFAQLQKQKAKTDAALQELKSTQSQLIQSEKMASLGELTAGIAHEIQNPLNFVNNFSEVNKELVDEMQTELKAGKIDDAIAISNDIKDNEEKINHHGKRADAIVKGMLQHSRSSSGTKEPTNINALADEYLRLAYHGLRAKEKSFNATMKTDFDQTIGKINIIPQDIGRVILNLITNAFYAVKERQKAEGNTYEPTVEVSTMKEGNNALIAVKDNGNGIPPKILDKIFQPFFTTKPTGQGTGLGLSLSYDIVKAHGGELKVETKEGEGSEFIIELPV